jgi:hypothetical protein
MSRLRDARGGFGKTGGRLGSGRIGSGNKGGRARFGIDWRGREILKQVNDELEMRLKEVAEMMRTEIVQDLSQGKSRESGSSRPGQPPHTMTGFLRRSISWQIHRRRDSKSVSIGSTAHYARILELGGVITPRVRRALAVPISPAAKRHARQGRSAIDFPQTLRMQKRTHGRAPMLVEDRGKGRRSRTMLHYVLMTSVRIAARPFLRPAIIRNKRKIQRMLMRPGLFRKRTGGAKGLKFFRVTANVD